MKLRVTGSLRPIYFGSLFLVGFGIAACLRYADTPLSARRVQSAAYPLIQQQDLAYAGAFRVPANSYPYVGSALAYNSANDSLYLANNGEVAELTIPEVRNASVISDLARAAFLQPPTDVFAGKRMTVDGGTANGVLLGGILPFNGSLIVSAYTYYDGTGTQSKSHFKTGTDFSNLGTVVGPVVISTAFRNPGAGFVAGYMVDVPSHWQAALGGVALTGQCCIPIISRSSYGPALSVFNPADIGRINPVPSTRLLGYPQSHTTLGGYGPDGSTAFHNGEMDMGGVIFPPGTSSVLFFGTRGTKFCYGTGTGNLSLHLQPVPGYPNEHYCYDPTNSNKGDHGYPYEQFVAAYDAADLVKVKNGQKLPWEIVPYAKWTFTLPFEIPSREITGVTYDPATRRIFVVARRQDNNAPLIHVFNLNPGSSGPIGNRLCY